jgi:hypothetical protein
VAVAKSCVTGAKDRVAIASSLSVRSGVGFDLEVPAPDQGGTYTTRTGPDPELGPVWVKPGPG